MNLFYEEFPDSIEISGQKIRIVTDFREYIKLLDMLKDDELSERDKIYILCEYFLDDVPDLEEAIGQLCLFVAMKTEKNKEESESGEPDRCKQLFSYSIDFPYILSGFLRDYRIDLCEIKYMHWWKFRMLFDGLSDDTEIKQRIMYRSIDLNTVKDKEERKRIRKIQSTIQLPEEMLSDYEIGEIFA